MSKIEISTLLPEGEGRGMRAMMPHLNALVTKWRRYY